MTSLSISFARPRPDLRFRRIEIPDFQFEVSSFYTRAFNGVFVFRHLKAQTDLLIVEDKAQRPPQ